MSEEILKALMQLFAIIAKQDDGASENERNFVEEFLTAQLNKEGVAEYLKMYDDYIGPIELDENGNPIKKLTSVKDSVRTVKICRQINKTLTQPQKVIVLLRLFELVAADRGFTEQRMGIINTVSDAFRISEEEYTVIHNFVIEGVEKLTQYDNILVADSQTNEDYADKACKHIHSHLDGAVIIMKVLSVEMYFLRYTGSTAVMLNGLPVNPKRVNLFARGSSIKIPSGTIFYSDVVSAFMTAEDGMNISFNANNLEFTFPNGGIGLRGINISESSGKLIGLMGASGAGKTTLLNALSGIETPSAGEVLINGIDIHKNKEAVKGIIGYIPQDDLLIEELTVFENLYYNAKLCFRDLTEEELVERVDTTIENLGLSATRDLKVGNPMEKTISGGQRKRLNIGLELIREPALLYVDEPTSGLSSRDSENVMELLRELTLKGKLIFVVIHQPSSDIYKMFDKIIFLDVGGYQIYYGNPVQAVIYFKQADNQVNADQGECLSCGTVNAELIFNIIESKVVDDYGNETTNRKKSPEDWNGQFKDLVKIERIEDIDEAPPSGLNIPSWFSQVKIFSIRDFLAKMSNTQYLAINLLEAPILAFILSFIIRYIEKEDSSDYIFYDNTNIPAYLFMSIIVALFIGLTVSAEEIFRDRKILKREKFLNLSRSSYLFSKIGILFLFSAIQSLLFTLVGNFILGIDGMFFSYWFGLFTVSCFANLLGLNISATFNSAVTIYILIPLLIIPQMILGGAMFSFDKLNKTIGGGIGVPLIAEFMPSRWAFEGFVVNQYVNNEFESKLYKYNRFESVLDYKQALYIPKLEEYLDNSYKGYKKARKVKKKIKKLDEGDEQLVALNHELDSLNAAYGVHLTKLSHELQREMNLVKKIQHERLTELVPDSFSRKVFKYTEKHIEALNEFYIDKYNSLQEKKNKVVYEYIKTPELAEEYQNARYQYSNQYLTELVRKNLEKNKVIEYEGELLQIVDPIYRDPEPSSPLEFRAHFYAPTKHIFGLYFPTYTFNFLVIWLMTIMLYVSLYYEWLKRFLDKVGDMIVAYKASRAAAIKKRRESEVVKEIELNAAQLEEQEKAAKRERRKAEASSGDDDDDEKAKRRAERRARREAAKKMDAEREAGGSEDTGDKTTEELEKERKRAERRARREAAKKLDAEREAASGGEQSEEDAEKEKRRAERKARREAAKKLDAERESGVVPQAEETTKEEAPEEPTVSSEEQSDEDAEKERRRAERRARREEAKRLDAEREAKKNDENKEGASGEE